MIRFRNRLRDRQGSALVLLVVAMLGILSLMALAIDLGMLRAARGEAQRAADAAALAGASAFMDAGDAGVESTARTRALAFAAKNLLHGAPFTAGETSVVVLPDRSTVRVTLRRPAVSTWFARMFGVTSAPVSARAAARATDAPSARCVKPFALADMWSDADDDHNGNRVEDGSERWKYEPDRGDFYGSGNPSAGSNKPHTGYGSSFRGASRDRGREVMLNVSPIPGYANLWETPNADPDDDDGLRAEISGCNSSPVTPGTPYRTQRGIKAGPIFQGVSALVERDPGARWDEARGEVVGSSFANWRDSPRLVRVPLYDPAELDVWSNRVEFVKFAWVFVEQPTGPAQPVVGRFVGIVRVLQLVE